MMNRGRGLLCAIVYCCCRRFRALPRVRGRPLPHFTPPPAAFASSSSSRHHRRLGSPFGGTPSPRRRRSSSSSSSSCYCSSSSSDEFPPEMSGSMKIDGSTTMTTSSSSASADRDDDDEDPLVRRGLPSPLVLGSASYNRRAILAEMNVRHVAVVRSIDERGIGDRSGDPGALALALANAKMDRLVDEMIRGNCDDELPPSRRADDDDDDGGGGGGEMGNNNRATTTTMGGWTILTADQVVSHGGRILEKPTSVEEARAFVSGYGDGAPCYTVGACVLAHHPTGLRCGGIEVASVRFGTTIADPDPRHLVDRLLDAGAPILGCAGGLMIEHPLVREHVVAIDGTEDSVMGLSKDLVERLMDELREKLDGIGGGDGPSDVDATRLG